MKIFKRWWILLLAICLVAAGGYAVWVLTQNGQRQKATATRVPPVIPVTAEPARKTDFRILITGIGTVTPLHTVSIKSRVDGQLMAVYFKEGQVVKQGDLLARIDPRPFEVQLAQAEGQMAKDRELLKNARLDQERYRTLWKQDSVSKQQLDTQEALVRQYEETLKSDQAAIDSAKLQLVYCRITAPVGGRLGLRNVDPGNIVRSTDATGLVVITQLQPITVIFPIPEDHLPIVLSKFKSANSLPVVVYDRELKNKLATGTLMTIDNQIDLATGTVRLKAIFANKNNELFPNQFVNARLLLDTRRDATVIPASAIQRGPSGTFVYIVKPDKTVAIRPVSVDDIQGGEAAIKQGLSPEELVVVDGTERLRDEARVEIRSRAGAGGRSGERAPAAATAAPRETPVPAAPATEKRGR